ARDIFVHRGAYGPRTAKAEVSKIWMVNPPGSGKRYSIRRDHEVTELIRQKLGTDALLLEAMLDLIERSLPVERVWLDVTERQAAEEDHERAIWEKNALESAKNLLTLLTKSGMPSTEAVQKIVLMDPFDRIENLSSRLAQLQLGEASA